MIRDKRKYLYLLLTPVAVAFVFISCDRVNKKGQPMMVKLNTKTDLVTEYIPVADSVIKEQLETQLELPKLERGFDGTQIRLIKFSAWGNEEKMIILTENANKWSAELIEFSIITGDDSLGIQILKSIKRKPRSKWKDVIKSLENYDIFYLPDSDSSGNYQIDTDCGAFRVEYVRGRDYRSYDYPCPDGNPFLTEAKKIMQISELIEEEFRFKDFGYLSTEEQ